MENRGSCSSCDTVVIQLQSWPPGPQAREACSHTHLGTCSLGFLHPGQHPCNARRWMWDQCCSYLPAGGGYCFPCFLEPSPLLLELDQLSQGHNPHECWTFCFLYLLAFQTSVNRLSVNFVHFPGEAFAFFILICNSFSMSAKGNIHLS